MTKTAHAIDLVPLRCSRCYSYKYVIPQPGWPKCCGEEMEEDKRWDADEDWQQTSRQSDPDGSSCHADLHANSGTS